MIRALAPVPFLLLAIGCEPTSVEERITISLANGEPIVRMDLEPVTLTDVDNNVDITVSFEAEDTTSTEVNTVVFTQYRIDYGFGDSCGDEASEDCAPYIAGEIYAEIAEGGSETLTLRGAVEEQLDWVQARYPGDEFDVPARVSFAGAYNENTGVTVWGEYTATFADYR
ncbi:MAG: hypothetical protein EP330_01705 [Deltaproteobacteria bacterium]|nr:MAG: hypothetical protein EP330_01705 [Deltaproteobacteria bacterium]